MYQLLNLKGKSALITGSTSGIGLAIGKSLLEAGAFCYFNSPFPEEEANLRNELRKVKLGRTDKSINLDESIKFIPADISSAAGCEGLVKQIHSSSNPKQQSVDILINNAGVQYVAAIEDLPVSKWDELINLHLSAPFHLIRLLMSDMKKNMWGRIVNLSSAHGLRASPFKSAYIASKHGLMGLSKVVALELAQTGVTSNCICPGYVRTRLVDMQIKDQAKVHNLSEEEVIKNIILAPLPTRKFTTIEDIASMVIHLCSPFANNITGTHVSMDGGWTAR